MPAELLIGADIAPTSKNTELFSKGDALSLVGKDLLDVLNHASYRICNLEIPLTDEEHPIVKRGPNLIAPTSTIAGYKALGIDFVTLANNHTLDQGKEGLESTIKALKQNGISYCGAGKSLSEAAEPFVFDFAGKKIGVYACAEHEFTIAGTDEPGANPYDPLESFDHVSKLKAESDYVIVLYHGGKEHYRYPSPDLQKRCRKFIDKGANLVVCQHSHIIGAKEDYKEATIVYGQGNFLFDCGAEEGLQTGLLIKLNENLDISYIPLTRFDSCTRLASGEKAAEILDAFAERSKEIAQEGFVQKKYSEFAEKMVDSYLMGITGKSSSFLFKVANKLTGHRLEKFWARRAFKKKELLTIENVVNCECHKELFLKGVINRRLKQGR